MGMKVGENKYNVHLDGYNFLPYFKGETDEGPRREFFYFADTGVTRGVALRQLEDPLSALA